MHDLKNSMRLCRGAFGAQDHDMSNNSFTGVQFADREAKPFYACVASKRISSNVMLHRAYLH